MQNETKFTPGPWRMETEAEPEDDSPVVYVCHAATVCDVTTICNMLPSRAASVEQRQANAHLIAAAPELYEALETCARYMNKPADFSGKEFMAAFHTARAALAKARGEA